MPDVQSRGVWINYKEVGEGEPALLCLPGWCTDKMAFEPLLAQDRLRGRVLALDWPGHGDSGAPAGDFGHADMVEHALAVIEASGAEQVIPVALSHSGWVAIELRRRLGDRIPKLVLLDWIILPPPPAFLDVLQGLQSARWDETREQLLKMWVNGSTNPELISYVFERVGAYGRDMWSRAGREIQAAYAAEAFPLKALSRLASPVPVLHLFCQPEEPAYLDAQLAFARASPWFHVRRLQGRTHFPMFEIPDVISRAIEHFIGRPEVAGQPVAKGSVPDAPG